MPPFFSSHLLCSLLLLLLSWLSWGNGAISGERGRICAVADLNRDHYTDLVVQLDDGHLVYREQNEDGEFNDGHSPSILVNGITFCSVADFNGDAVPDILLSSPDHDGLFNVSVLFGSERDFHLVTLGRFAAEPMVVDVNGDGIADLITFHASNGSFACFAGTISNVFSSCVHLFSPIPEHGYPRFPHAFVDLNGDLNSEIVLGLRGDDQESLQILVWTQSKRDLHNWTRIELIPRFDTRFKAFAGAVIADFNGDGIIDVGLPHCPTEDCKKVDSMFVWQGKGKTHWDRMELDLKDAEVMREEHAMAFRVGDFSLDGYPDMLATLRIDQKTYPLVIDNLACDDCVNVSRRFRVRTSPRLVEPSGMALGNVMMTSFFDLKEDGNLDILVEYVDSKGVRYFDFIRCDDKGDTTFLKVQVFTSVCSKNCPGARGNEIGSGVAWHGACVHFTMSNGWGETKQGSQCQLSQSTGRSLALPFALFGLGRSPNFVDFVNIGVPRPSIPISAQRTELKQIVPNSRVVVVPPPANGNIGWQSRLYLTPSQLIIQSLIVLAAVCILLLLVVFLLHWKEKREDRQERQAQSHRFHFDAM